MEEKRLHRSRNQQIRSEMGLSAYYSFSKQNRRKRDYLERMSPLPEVYLDADQAIQAKYPDPIKKPGDEEFAEETEEDPNKRAGDKLQ